ncbi:MAG: hypothetical protein ACTS5V_08985 [Giesbergeria sp.]
MPTLDWLNNSVAQKMWLRWSGPAGAHAATPCLPRLQKVAEGAGAARQYRPPQSAPLVVYGEAYRLGEARLAQAMATFKHIPYDVKAR